MAARPPAPLSSGPSRRFYATLWSSEKWGSARPNIDERLRAERIVRFIEEDILPGAPDRHGLRILDLGCGRGWLTQLLGAYGRVVGVDPVPEAIQRARELYPDVDVRVGSAAEVKSSIGSSSFDLVVASEVIEHVPGVEQSRFVREIHELLTPGGFAILTTPRGELWNSWQRFHPYRQPVEDWLTERELHRLSKASGFEMAACDRVFVPGYRHCFVSRVVGTRPARRWMERFSGSRIVKWLLYQSAIYQVILLRRPLPGVVSPGET